MTRSQRQVVAVVCVLLGAPKVAHAESPATAFELAAETAPTLLELHELASELAAADPTRRKAAMDALRSLGEDALPAIRARIAELRTRGFDIEATLSALTELRRVQGVEAPDAPVDLAVGISPLLERARGAGALHAAELVLLLRGLEAQKSPAAADVIVGELFALDARLFRYEAPRTRERLSVLLIPALIRHRTHAKSWVRRFADDSLLELHIDSPGRAVQQDDVVLLAAILDAYGDTLTFDAMPVVVSYVMDERVAVRAAADRAVRRFGKNAIWQLRERYVNATGNEPNASWGWQRTLDELHKLLDEPKRDAHAAAVREAEGALSSGDVNAAAARLDRALLENPHDAGLRQLAPLYARIGAAHLERGGLPPALAAYRRAVRLDPASDQAARARVLYLEAELRLSQGVVDLSAYEKALSLDPSFSAAHEALAELSGERAARDRWIRKLVGLCAALLMVIGGIALLRRRELEPEAHA